MAANSDKISQLISNLEMLHQRHEKFTQEINELRDEIGRLKAQEFENEVIEMVPETLPEKEITLLQSESVPLSKPEQPFYELPGSNRQAYDIPAYASRNIEKFIGENLISKIGIIITVIGIAIGAKYSIDHDLISPLMRIIMGYVAGSVMFGLGLKLRHNYKNYSAVLVSGAMATMYFITYFAYGFYSLMPQVMAFALMVLFTGVTVSAALNYNLQVIAHIGLVGAYGVPFLLGDNSGKVSVLFSYMAIINCGILIISFKNYWKPIYYTSFAITWLMYIFWYYYNDTTTVYFEIALIFDLIFFVVFYIAFLAYKLVQKEKYSFDDVALLLLNSFIFFGIGYAILSHHPIGKHWLGLFSVCNAAIHAIVAFVFYKQKLADRNLGYLVIGLALTFTTIAIPVQLNGNWVTLLWAGEAALLFWIGRTRKVDFYEIYSYPLMILAFFSILNDWQKSLTLFGLPDASIPFLNIGFGSSLLFAAVFGYINFVQNYSGLPSAIRKPLLVRIFSYIITGIFLISLYNAFRLEIINYWQQRYLASQVVDKSANLQIPVLLNNEDMPRFQDIWVLNYTLIFVSILAVVNYKWIRNQVFAHFVLVIKAVVMLVFLFVGLYLLSELRDSYLQQTNAEYFHHGIYNLIIRYISIGLVVILILAAYKFIYKTYLKVDLRIKAELCLHICLAWIASSELINWMDIAGSEQAYKLGLSILWGSYSLLLIILGIWKRKKYLRIGAIILFGGTLAKLFFYDISHLDTIAKTIVFVSLGVILLIISFLYNKYKAIITDQSVED